MNNKKFLALAGGLSLFAATALEGVALAAPELTVKCEVRTGSRSKISVDGKNLTGGDYTIVVTSNAGANSASTVKNVPGGANDEFEADFDSNRGDIRRGATAIASNFIVNGTVDATVTGPVNLSATNVACRVR